MKHMNTRLVFGIALLFAAINSAGCSTIAKKAIRESVGTESDVSVISESGSASYAKFGDVEVLPLESDLGPLVPGAFRVALPTAIRTSLMGKEGALRGGKGRTLSIQPIATFFLIKGSLKELVGSNSYAACIFSLRDGKREITRVQIIARSGANHTDLSDFAREMGRALNDHMLGRVPD